MPSEVWIQRQSNCADWPRSAPWLWTIWQLAPSNDAAQPFLSTGSASAFWTSKTCIGCFPMLRLSETCVWKRVRLSKEGKHKARQHEQSQCMGCMAFHKVDQSQCIGLSNLFWPSWEQGWKSHRAVRVATSADYHTKCTENTIYRGKACKWLQMHQMPILDNSY